MDVFFSDADRTEYLEHLSEWFVAEREDDPLAVRSDMLADITDRRFFLLEEEAALHDIRRHSRTGRPLGSDAFLAGLEQMTGRHLLPRKRGPKPSS